MDTGRISTTDLVSAGLIVALLGLLALLALLGYPFAEFALPFAAGGAAGYGAARVVASARVPRWVRALAVVSAAVALVWGSLSLILPILTSGPGQGSMGFDLYGIGTVPVRVAFGFGLVYFEEVFQRFSFPVLYPRTAEEDDRQSRERLRGVLIVGGLVFGLVALGGIVFGALALLAYLVALFGG